MRTLKQNSNYYFVTGDDKRSGVKVFVILVGIKRKCLKGELFYLSATMVKVYTQTGLIMTMFLFNSPGRERIS